MRDHCRQNAANTHQIAIGRHVHTFVLPSTCLGS